MEYSRDTFQVLVPIWPVPRTIREVAYKNRSLVNGLSLSLSRLCHPSAVMLFS